LDEEVFGFREERNAAGGLELQPLAEIISLSSKVHDVQPVVSPVSLNRVSMQLIPRDEAGTYHMQFVFDTTVGCDVKLYFFCDNESKFPMDTPTYHFDSGLEQVFITNDEYFLNTNDKTEEEINEFIESGHYPVIVHIDLPIVDDTDDKDKKNVRSLITYATLLRCSDGYEIKAIEQKLMYGSTPYIIHDIYGIDHTSTAPPEECVICMTELRDTVVIPCRHLCICHQCAQLLHYQSNKCPICRGVVRSMIRIKIKDERSTHEDSSSEEKKKDGPSLKKGIVSKRELEEVEILS